MNVGRDKRPFELVMNLVAGGIAIGIGARPSVVLHGNVQWLRTVAHIVSQPAGVKNNRRLDRLCVLPPCGKKTVLAHCSLQPLPNFIGLPRLQADLLGPLARGEDHGFKVESLVGQWAQRVSRFQIDEVLGRLRGAQFRFGG